MRKITGTQYKKDAAKAKEGGKLRPVNFKYKDGVFRTLFNDEGKLLELYNALRGTNYGSDTKIEITTLEDMIYMDVKNDISFILDNKYIVFAEHQSTLCPNMPIRMATYVGETFRRMLGDNVYREKALKIPAPELYVFYNGRREVEDVKEYRLSDNFAAKPPENSIEVVVKLVNINYNKDKKLLQKSRTLMEYSRFVYLVNEALKQTESLPEAIRDAVEKAQEEGILTEFLRKYGTEALNKMYGELTKERYGELRELDGIDIGYARGMERGIECGMARGISQGISQGAAQKNLENAKAFKSMGVDASIIARATGLSMEEIKKL